MSAEGRKDSNVHVAYVVEPSHTLKYAFWDQAVIRSAMLRPSPKERFDDFGARIALNCSKFTFSCPTS
jgi:hypothetical protein